jgi:hypothetical protein
VNDRLPAYTVVSPVKDEAEFLPLMARSLAAQTHPPQRWVIVDDGSTDGTTEIARALETQHDWCAVVQFDEDGARARGGRIVRAFEAGLAQAGPPAELIVKLDGDIHLPSHYFAWVAETFARVPTAGVVGGVGLIPEGDGWQRDNVAAHTVNGIAKTYRRACLESIGGLRASMGWDGIDEYGARARGWTVHVLEELPILHYRRRGARQSWRKARWEEGIAAHYMGYRTEFLLLRACYRMARETPPVAGGLVLAAAFASARLRRAPQIDDPAARALLRAEQRERMGNLLRLRGRTVAQAPLPGGGPARWAAADAAEAQAPGMPAKTSRSSAA